MTKPLKITELYAWIATDDKGEDGIVAMAMDGLGWVPMIGSDKERIESYRENATAIGKQAGYPIKLCRFHGMEVLETKNPKGH